MRKPRQLALVPLLVASMTACHGTAPKIPPMRSVPLVIASTAGLEMRLEPRNASLEAIRVPGEGGRFVVPIGSWQLRAVGTDQPASAVPAFAEVSDTELRVVAEPWPSGDGEFATIPAGPALCGDRLGVGQPDERPARILYLPAFQLGRREVTNADYAEFLNATNAADTRLGSWLDLQNRKCRIDRADSGSFTTDAPDFPVVTVSWAGARAYCAWRTQIGRGTRYRLPTQFEWEKAARGPWSFVYSYGDTYQPTAANQESGRIKPAGSYDASPWGLFDMTGNAFEWTSTLVNPTPEAGPRAVLRGGSFVLDGIFLRNAFRMLLRPSVRADDVGFRVLRELPTTDQIQ